MGRPARQKSNAMTHAFNGSMIEHEDLSESAAKRHELTEHLKTADRVHHVHHHPSIAKHRRRDSQPPTPHALDL